MCSLPTAMHKHKMYYQDKYTLKVYGRTTLLPRGQEPSKTGWIFHENISTTTTLALKHNLCCMYNI